jgi:hypothetical protein
MGIVFDQDVEERRERQRLREEADAEMRAEVGNPDRSLTFAKTQTLTERVC